MTVFDVLPWVLSCLTLATMWLAGSKNIWAWYIGIPSQGLWLILDIHYQAWGLIPIAVALTFIYARNLRAWRRI